ncbi:MAG: hypothetical protein WC554_16340 [Clostridia bacterium]|jgi:hypothetical protein
MIVTTGQAACGEIISDYAATAAFTYMGIGTGATAAALNQTALVTPAGARVACSSITEQSTTVAGDTVRFLGLFTIMTQTVVSEIGIFNDDTAGTMLSRVVLTPAVTAPANSIFVGIVNVVATDGGSL